MSLSSNSPKAVYERIPTKGDGNCLFRSISTYIFASDKYHKELRLEAAEYVSTNWNYLEPYILEECGSIEKVEEYVDNMKQDGIYGTSVECLALSDLYNININIYTKYTLIVVKNGYYTFDAAPVKISLANYPNNLYLLFSGNPVCGHFDLLVPIDPDVYFEDSVYKYANEPEERKKLNFDKVIVKWLDKLKIFSEDSLYISQKLTVLSYWSSVLGIHIIGHIFKGIFKDIKRNKRTPVKW